MTDLDKEWRVIRSHLEKLFDENKHLRAENKAAWDSAEHNARRAEEAEEDAKIYRHLISGKYEVRLWSPDGESNRVRAWFSGANLDAALKSAMGMGE